MGFPRGPSFRRKVSEYTPTQERILHLLADGQYHPVNQLVSCLNDPEMSGESHLHPHLTHLRKKLHPLGQDIIFRNIGGRVHYAHVRIVAINSEDQAPPTISPSKQL